MNPRHNPDLDINVAIVEARRLKSRWTMESAQDVASLHYGDFAMPADDTVIMVSANFFVSRKSMKTPSVAWQKEGF